MDNIKTDANALCVKMAEKGYRSIVALSRDADVDRMTLSKVLKGKSQPSTQVMYKLVSTLNIEPSDAGEIFFAKKLTY